MHAGSLAHSHWLGLLVLLFILQPAAARTETISPAAMQTGSLLLATRQGYVTATLLNTDVNITVNGLVARVSVMQEFENTSRGWVEGTYVFPLPGRAAVDRMRLYVGDRFIEGEIREKQQARQKYDQARQAGKKTTLVEQYRANLFRTSIANIAPGETVIVEIEYLEDLAYDDGLFSLRYPMTITPRYVADTPLPDRRGDGWAADTDQADDTSLISSPMVVASGGHNVSLRASVNAGMPLEFIASRYHPIHVSENGEHYSVTLSAGRVPMDHDFELLWRAVPASAPRAVMFAESTDGRPHYLLMVIPPLSDGAAVATLPREVIFIIDTSGSMHGVSIVQARKAVRRALGTLAPGDAFNVIAFNSRARSLFPESVPAGAGNIGVAEAFVGGLGANGGTNMHPALERALRSPPREGLLKQVIFVTDGAVGNEKGLFGVIRNRLQGARLFTVGIGSAPNSWFMRKAAEAGRGSFTTISALHEVGEKMDRLFRKLEHPQVTDIRIEWPGGVELQSYPRPVPDLYRGEPVTLKVRASGDFRPGDSVRISGDSVAGAWSRDLSLGINRQSPGVGALWARARIADLLHAGRRSGDVESIRSEVVTTAIEHHLVSKYTSLIAVDKTPVRPAGESLSGEQLPNLVAHGQSGSAIFGFPATATRAEALGHSGALLVALALLLLLLLQVPRIRRAPLA